MRHDLPSGAWVELRDPMLVTHGEWQDALDALDDDTRNDVFVAIVAIDAWSYESPPPTVDNHKTIRDIPQVDAKEIGRLLVPILRMLHPLFGPSEDPESPTEPSSD